MTHSFKHHDNDAHTVRPVQHEHFQRSTSQHRAPQYNAPQDRVPEHNTPARSFSRTFASSFNRSHNQSSSRTCAQSSVQTSASSRKHSSEYSASVSHGHSSRDAHDTTFVYDFAARDYESSDSVASDCASQGFMERFQNMLLRRRKQKARALFNKRYGEEKATAGAASGSLSGASSRSTCASAAFAASAGAAQTGVSHSNAANTHSRTPKAAIYEGSSRRAHKNTASFEDARKRPAPSRYSKATLLDRVLERLHLSGKKAVVIGVVVCVCAIIIFLYEPTRNYYQGLRMNQAKQIELEALQDSVQYLETNTNEIRGDEGARMLARKRGYVANNETLGQVDGLSDDYSDQEANKLRALHRNVARGYAPPDTWYSPVLDVLFGVKKTPDSRSSDTSQRNSALEDSEQNGNAANTSGNAPQNGSATSANGNASQNGGATKSSNGAQHGNSEQNGTVSKNSNASHNSNGKNTSRGSEQSR